MKPICLSPSENDELDRMEVFVKMNIKKEFGRYVMGPEDRDGVLWFVVEFDTGDTEQVNTWLQRQAKEQKWSIPCIAKHHVIDNYVTQSQ